MNREIVVGLVFRGWGPLDDIQPKRTLLNKYVCLYYA